MSSFGQGYPEICPSATCLEPLNPAVNATYELLDDLLDDLTGGVRSQTILQGFLVENCISSLTYRLCLQTRGSGLFPDNVIHLGGKCTQLH